LSPADDVDVTPHLFQRPFLRMVAAGPFWISIFFLLSGYVCAIKPLRLSRAGQPDDARKVVASSAFRRLFRIGIPAAVGTIFPWILTQMGVFQLIPELALDGGWLSFTTPKRVEGIWASISELIKQIVKVCFDVI
jgi:peptidoglycan/LPS O-acetylase OafA/YrhL